MWIKDTTLPKLSGPTPYSSVFIYVLRNVIGAYYLGTKDTWQESEKSIGFILGSLAQ